MKFHRFSKKVIDGTTSFSSYLNIYPLINKAKLFIDGTKISSAGIFLNVSNQYIPNISNL